MFHLQRPSDRDIDAFLEESRSLPLSYGRVGIADTRVPGFDSDALVSVVGSGDAAFARAKAALCAWRHFHLGWCDVVPRGAPIDPGTVVAVVFHHLGFWSLNGCRVVYRIGSDDGPRFGFAYGTLTNHAECGEEMFEVALAPDSGDVTYRISAASKPRAALARLGYPVVRLLQARFRRESARAIARAVRNPDEGPGPCAK